MSLKNLKAELDTLNAIQENRPNSISSPKPKKTGKPKNGPAAPRASAGQDSRTSQISRYSEDENESQKASIRKLDEIVKAEPSVRKVVKRAAVLADLCTDEDLETDARVIREACDANHRYFDIATKTWSIIPDHKTRLAATTLRRAYVEGTPVKREVKIIQDFRSTNDVLADIRQSPEGMRTLRALSGLGVDLEIEGEIVSAEDVQEKGCENPPVA